jgi:GTP-binding protein
MIPADSIDISKDFNILMEELKKYNPELLDKKRVLAVTKSDLLDEELRAELSLELPENIDSVFISSVTYDGIDHLKDVVWSTMNK